MSLFALGINHHTAPVAIREQVAVDGARLTEALDDLTQSASVREVAIVSTCNRMEIYGVGDADFQSDVYAWLHRFHALPSRTLDAYVYQLDGAEVPRHLFQVAAGLDSMVLGEPQILGQVKTAYRVAKEQQRTGVRLDHLFQHAFEVAKKIRSTTAIGENTLSVAAAAVNLARQIFSDLSQQSALLIGAGDTVELLARHLHGRGLHNLFIANRSIDKAETLANRFQGEAISLTDIATHIGQTDIIFSSTASPAPIVTKKMVTTALAPYKRHPVLMIDLAVPRDIEPSISQLADIYLYTLDDLHSVVAAGRASRVAAAQDAHLIIDEEVRACMAWVEGRSAIKLLRNFRKNGERQRDETLARAKSLLTRRHDPNEALEFLANTLMNKLLHAPTKAIKQASLDGRDEFLDTACSLLDIHLDDTDADKN